MEGVLLLQENGCQSCSAINLPPGSPPQRQPRGGTTVWNGSLPVRRFCYRLSPDTALRLVRRKRGTSLPRPQCRSRLHYAACLAERAELMPSRLFPVCEAQLQPRGAGGSAIHLLYQSLSEAPVRAFIVGSGHLFLPPLRQIYHTVRWNGVCS